MDTFRITIYERPDGSHYGQAIARLITDCVNKVISVAGPVTHMEQAPL